MRRSSLAKSLVNAANNGERRRLLAANPRLADAKLGEEIRKICYAVWAANPATAQRAALALKVLSQIDKGDRVRAIGHWIEGISNITKGRFPIAARELDRAYELFGLLGREVDAAQTQVAKLLALGLMGQYDEAVAAGKKARRTFLSAGDNVAAGKIEMNLSNIAARRSRHREAERYALSASKRFQLSNERMWEAMAENDLANTYMELNEFQKAEDHYRRALQTAGEAKMRVTEAEVEASMGNLAAFRGEYAQALEFLELSRGKYRSLGMPHQTAIADLEIADIYSVLNLKDEAIEIYKEVSEAFRKLRLRNEEARARSSLGRSAAALGETLTARRAFARAQRLYDAEKDEAGSIAVMLADARLEFEQGRVEAALRLLTVVRTRLNKTNYRRHLLMADLLEGEIMLVLGRYDTAEADLQRVYAEAVETGQTGLAQAAVNGLAQAATRQGDDPAAEKHYRTSIQLSEEMRSSFAAAEFSMSFLSDKIGAYEGLAHLYISQGRIEKAFIISERSRARSLLDSISGRNRPLKVPRGQSQRLNVLRTELNWLYKRGDDPEAGDASVIPDGIVTREREIAELSRQINSLTRKGTSKRDPELVDVERLTRQLGTDRTLIEYIVTDENISAFVVSGGGVGLVRNICRTSDVIGDLEDLQFQFSACRFGLGTLGNFKNELKRRADLCLSRLYERLIAPLADSIDGTELIIVPSGPLNYVPFPALWDGERYLVERYIVGHAPAAAVWSLLQTKRSRPSKTALLVGYADERIPLVESEIKSISGLFDEPTVLSGPAATLSAFASSSPKADIIHLACHGQFRADNPTFSSLHLADGWITVRDIYSQRLKASVVTLSACETGMSKVFPGNEILGLTQGFLVAGATSLIVSLWTVNDTATTELMRGLYAALLTGASPAASLRETQLAFIRRGDHPYLWAPFVSIGR